MSEATVSPTRRLSVVWVIPLAALIIAVWTLVQNALSQGPEVEITFATAEGLSAGQTQVKLLDVEIGLVEEVRLSAGYDEVIAVARLQPSAAELLTEDAQFWVVRPRIGSQGISGLSTILSGAYIELAPGNGESGRRSFRGLDDMPLTPPSSPGLNLQLIADNATSISTGSPVLYNGYRVGRVEEARLDEVGQTHMTVFIDAPYDDLVTTATRFWNASGVSMNAGANGFSLRTESLEAIITGGIAFGLPDGTQRGQPVNDGVLFYLYAARDDITVHPHMFAQEYLLLFESSVRGLAQGAAVEYRGMRVGTVAEVGFADIAVSEMWSENGGQSVPVIIHLEPGWLGNDTEGGAEEFGRALEASVEKGLRASLSTANLLTSSLFISLDIHEDAEAATIEQVDGITVLPTRNTGLSHIEDQVVSLLGKLQSLPLEETLTATNAALTSMEVSLSEAGNTLHTVDELLKQDGTQQLPEELAATLVELRGLLGSLESDSPLRSELVQSLQQLRQTLSSATTLLETYERKPNAIIFGGEPDADPIPGSSAP